MAHELRELREAAGFDGELSEEALAFVTRAAHHDIAFACRLSASGPSARAGR